MNRKQKIIISVVGITIVLLALLGITYAYYLTRIEGNTNTNSISVTTADLKLTYGDGTTKILTKNNIVPNTEVGTKDFTVTNSGNSTIDAYSVVLEYAQLEGVIPSIFKYPNDFEITLTCSSSKSDKICNGFSGKWNNENILMVENSIDVDEVQSYDLSIFYADSGIDQSDDMGKNLNLKVQIYNSSDVVDLYGEITGVEEGDSVFLNSNPKASPILKKNINGVDKYYYKFVGVEIGTHSLSIIDKDTKQSLADNSIIINKADERKIISNNKVAVTDNSSFLVVNTNVSAGTVVPNVISIDNPFYNNLNSLAYHIINNSVLSSNGTHFYKKTPTLVADKGATDNWSAGEEENIYFNTDNLVSYSSRSEANEYCADYENGYYGGYVCLEDPEYCIEYGYDYETLCSDYAQITESTSCEDYKGKYVYDSEKYLNTFVSDCDGDIPVSGTAKYEKVLSYTSDNYGTSYFYRGNVSDNYVNFAGMCWRIVRINGNGDIRLILEDQYTTCNDPSFTGNWNLGDSNIGFTKYAKNTLTSSQGLTNSKNPVYVINYLNGNSSSLGYRFKNFQANKLNSYFDYLQSGDWCMDQTVYNDYNGSLLLNDLQISDSRATNTSFVYDSYVRLRKQNKYKKPTLKCDSKYVMTYWDSAKTNPMYVGALTIDEVMYAGGIVEGSKPVYYLLNDWHKYNNLSFATISLGVFSAGVSDNVYYVRGDGHIFYYGVEGSHIKTDWFAARPAITLKNSVTISNGDGTKNNPYVIG